MKLVLTSIDPCATFPARRSTAPLLTRFMSRRIHILLVCALLVLVTAPRLGFAWFVESARDGAVSMHADGTPCHDDTDPGAPCDDGCRCACCATARVTPPIVTVIVAPPSGPAAVLAATVPIDLHPAQTALRLFRPPKA